MTIEERLNHVANRYRSLGYKVATRPGPDELPAFAKDFKVEIVATGDKGNVLAVAKASPSELQADQEVARYSEITSNNLGGEWMS
jgi:REase_AHJR-like